MMLLPKVVLLTGVWESSKKFAGFRGVWNFETVVRRGNHEPGNLFEREVTDEVAERHPFVASEAQIVHIEIIEFGGRLGSGGSEV